MKQFFPDTIKTFLDIGCKDGNLFCEMNERGFDAYGVDEIKRLSPEVQKLYGNKFFETPLDRMWFDTSFDLGACFFDVLPANKLGSVECALKACSLLFIGNLPEKHDQVLKKIPLIANTKYWSTTVASIQLGYPIVEIPIERLRYMMEHTGFPQWTQFACDSFVGKHISWLFQLKTSGEVKIKNIDDKRIQRVFNSVKKDGLINPLIVKKGPNDFYYVVVGNQRLTCLRALNYKGTVKCRIGRDNDPWDGRIAALKLYPYEEVKGAERYE